MGTFSIWHWLIVLAIVMLIFGTKKLRNFGADLGGAVRGFKDGLQEGTSVEHGDDNEAPAARNGKLIEGVIRAKSDSAAAN